MKAQTCAKLICSRVLAVLVALLSVLPSSAHGRLPPPNQVLLSAPHQQGPTDPQELEAFLDTFFAEQMETLHIPGAVFILVKDGETFFTKGYGLADLESQRPVIPDETLFRVGSVSKLFTATVIMQLVEQGRLNLDDDVNEYLKSFQLSETLTHFKARQLPMTWRISPSTRPANLGKHLEAHGLTHTVEPGMAVDLLALNEDRPKPSSLKIEYVRDVETLKKFSQAANIGFGMPESVGNAVFDIEAGLGFGRHLPRHHYVGLLKGEPVATSTLFLGAGVAGIYTVATVPEARGQGIGSAMTLAPLLEARAMGYRLGVLQASQMGLNMYRRLGFKEYCKVSYYSLGGEKEGRR